MNDTASPPLPNNKTSKLAVTGLVLGILGTFCLGILAGLPALVCGTISLCRLKQYPARKNQVMALITLCLSLVSIFFTTAFLAGLLVPGINGALTAAKQTRNVADAKQIGLMLLEYANEHNGKYPDSFEVFIADTLKDEDGEKREILFYQPGTRELRWKYTPGLTTDNDPETVLLESNDPALKGKTTYTIGHTAEFIKNRKK
jgi:type II secretory pathway pseudopilin PulG